MKVDMPCTIPEELEGRRFHNITISGLPGCGSTTMLHGLRDALSPLGWRAFSGGEFMRHVATEKGLWDSDNPEHHNAAIFTDEFENEVDYGMREKLNNEYQWILESWLSGFMAQGVDSTLKILMTCGNDAVRIDRVVNRDGISVEEAKANTLDRYDKNLAKWTRMYGHKWQEWVVDTGKMKASDPIDFWHEDLYDLIIDTYGLTQEESLDIVMRALKDKA